MRISYNIYRNDGRGGAVDYGLPVASTTQCSYDCGLPGRPSDTTFAVRAIDLDSGLEEANTEARVRLVLDSAGQDISRRLGPVMGLAARVVATASCRVVWNYVLPPNTEAPVQFAVSLTQGTVAGLSDVRALIPYNPKGTGYETILANIPVNVGCVLAVRALGNDLWLAGDPVVIPIFVAVAQLQDVDNLLGSNLA